MTFDLSLLNRLKQDKKMPRLSAEPGCKAAYSKDIRWRVVGKGLVWNFATEILQETSTYLWEQCVIISKGSSKLEMFRHWCHHPIPARDELLIIGLLMENSSLYLSEVCQTIQQSIGVAVSPATVCRVIRRHGMTRKKIRQIALQRSVCKRGKFRAEILLFNSVDKFVWADETGSDRRDQIRKFGYSLRGESPVYRRLLSRGERISTIGAICTDGLVAYKFVKGTVNGEKFCEFLQGTLIPEMLPFDGENPRSVLILDNASIHKVEPVKGTLQRAKILTLFLPPYSPDLNPIEEMFSYIKYYLKDHDIILQSMTDTLPLLKASFDSVTPQQCKSWIQHAGY